VSCVQIPLETWVFVFSVYVAALRQADPPSKESYRLCIELRNWKRSQGPQGYIVIDRDREYLNW
jgi:hypothetical protein